MLVLKRGKIAKMEGVLLPDGQVMKEIKDRGYRHTGNRSLEGKGDEGPILKGI